MKILLLEDDFTLADIISEYFKKLSYDTTIVYAGNDAQELLYSDKFDLLIFDINVPQLNGLKILQEFREAGFKTPIIFISSSTNISDFKIAYENGGNDFIRKPFKLEELKIRIEYIKEMFNIQSKKILTINKNIQFNLKNMSIIKDLLEVKLPKKEAEIIKYLLLNKNRLISIDELIINIWDYSKEPSIATIRTYIKNIRKILNDSSLETIKGLGYMLKIA